MEFSGAPATIALIIANLVASVYALSIDQRLASRFAF